MKILFLTIFTSIALVVTGCNINTEVTPVDKSKEDAPQTAKIVNQTPTTNTTNSKKNKTTKTKASLLIRQIMDLAYGSQQSINSVPFTVGDSLEKVIKEWGPPEDLGTAAANYWSRHVHFLYDGSTGRKTITEINDFDPQLRTIHLSDVKGLFGNPVSEKEQEGMYYVTYTDNKNYTVIFVFESARINPDPTLNLYIVQKPTLKHK